MIKTKNTKPRNIGVVMAPIKKPNLIQMILKGSRRFGDSHETSANTDAKIRDNTETMVRPKKYK